MSCHPIFCRPGGQNQASNSYFRFSEYNSKTVAYRVFAYNMLFINFILNKIFIYILYLTKHYPIKTAMYKPRFVFGQPGGESCLKTVHVTSLLKKFGLSTSIIL